MLSGYRMMWMLVMFDLPVKTKTQRKAATKFREFLLGQGFAKCQLSVYLRFCGGKEHASTYTNRIQKALVGEGLVQVLCFTDKQYENILSFRGKAKQRRNQNPQQYALF